MHSRKFALTLARQYRTCPPPEIRDDPSQRRQYERHLARCPYCAMETTGESEAWAGFRRELERLFKGLKEPPREAEVRPGQFRFIKRELSVWRDDLFYNPPMVLVLENTAAISDDMPVCQVCADISLAGPGDLILQGDQSPVGDVFLESWNVYILKAADMGETLGHVPPEIVRAVRSLENDPDAYPEWAMLPRPMTENDPRIFFRQLEIEVGHIFSVQSKSELMKAAESPLSRLIFPSPGVLRDAVCRVAPGTCWRRKTPSAEEVLAFAELPTERLALAAGEITGERTTANLVRVKHGAVWSVESVDVEIYGRSGALTVSGRILGLPEQVEDAALMCFLVVSDDKALSPVRYEWKKETGDFLVEFRSEEGLKGTLKTAVVVETEGI